MNPKKCAPVLLVLILACGRNKMQRDQQQYDVVQEGSVNGVKSTINGPGETPSPVTSSTITGTNVDTTTAFTLPGTATTTEEQPGTIAGTLPAPSSGFPGGYIPRPPGPRPRPAPSTTTMQSPPPQAAPTATDTIAPTTTSSSATDTSGESIRGPEKPKKDENSPPPPPTPPTRKDTIGTHS